MYLKMIKVVKYQKADYSLSLEKNDETENTIWILATFDTNSWFNHHSTDSK